MMTHDDMKNITLFSLLMAVVWLAGCSRHSIHGDGNIISESRSVADFARLDVTGAYDIRWTNGPVALAITTDSNLLVHIKTVVDGDKLRIYSDESLSSTRDIKVVVSSSAMRDLSLTGAIHLAADGISGAELNIDATGASDIVVAGMVTNLTVNLTGADDLKASGLSAGTAEIGLVGASDARVAVSDRLKISITGAGSLTYAGNPVSVEENVVGAGSVHREK